MTLDIRGGLKNTAKNKNEYVPFEEMLSNAIDSYLIRRNIDKNAPAFFVHFNVEIVTAGLLGDQFDLIVSCTDNGAGFDDPQVKAFVTKDTSYKDDLQIPGMGKCKGAGRIQFFHHFHVTSIDSKYQSGSRTLKRRLTIDSSVKEISEASFVTTETTDGDLTTTITLSKKRLDTGESVHPEVYSSASIERHLYTAFLQRLIVLKGLVGDFSIAITERFGEKQNHADISAVNLPSPSEKINISLHCNHGITPKTAAALAITRYSLPAEDFPGFQHEVALCANAAIVYPLTKYFLKNPAERRRALNEKFELILVEGDVLEAKVNHQRDGFLIPRECEASDDLQGDFSIEDIIESLEDYVYQIFTPADFDRNELVKATQNKFGISLSMLEEVNVKIHYGDTEENIAKRVLKKYQEEIVKDTSNFIDLKQQLLKLDPRSQGFREKINELSWKYTSSIKKIDMSNLSQLVVRRSAMIEVLRLAVDKLLDCQAVEPGKRNENEKIIHNVFFPTGKDSSDAKDHDIWLLNEEYQYFEHIASDKALSTLRWLDGTKIFEVDIDESLQKLFIENNENHSEKRPDIAIFSQEGSAIIIEFKAPNVPIQEHINDLAQYARLLAAKSGGKIKKFYGYLIGTTLDHSRMPTNWTAFPDRQGYFSTGQLVDPETGRPYGELYSELLFYKQFIDRADRRLTVYKNKLKLSD
jgi:hypothetical protein